MPRPPPVKLSAQFWAAIASPKSHFMTDEEAAFMGIGWNFASHGPVKHTANEYVRNTTSNLKRFAK